MVRESTTRALTGEVERLPRGHRRHDSATAVVELGGARRKGLAGVSRETPVGPKGSRRSRERA